MPFNVFNFIWGPLIAEINSKASFERVKSNYTEAAKNQTKISIIINKTTASSLAPRANERAGTFVYYIHICTCMLSF